MKIKPCKTNHSRTITRLFAKKVKEFSGHNMAAGKWEIITVLVLDCEKLSANNALKAKIDHS